MAETAAFLGTGQFRGYFLIRQADLTLAAARIGRLGQIL
jgi:hypothetical protein